MVRIDRDVLVNAIGLINLHIFMNNNVFNVSLNIVFWVNPLNLLFDQFIDKLVIKVVSHVPWVTAITPTTTIDLVEIIRGHTGVRVLLVV